MSGPEDGPVLDMNNGRAIDRFVVFVHDTTVYKGCPGRFIHSAGFVDMAEQVVMRGRIFYASA